MATQPKKNPLNPIPAHDAAQDAAHDAAQNADVPLILPALEHISLSPVTTLREASAQTERTERSDAAANRKRILQVAETLFAERGVGNVNMADIAKSAGVGQGTLYRRFANKSHLCLALLDTQMADFQNAVITQLGQMMRASQPPLQQLEWFLDALVHFNDRHFPLLCVARRDLPVEPTTQPGPWIWQQMTVRALLQSAVRAGEIPPAIARELDVPIMTNLLLAPMHPETFRGLNVEADGNLSRISAGLQYLVALLRRK